VISETYWISMGGPSGGVLRFSNGLRLESCNTSMVWSDDSKYLAVQQWTLERNQRLLVLSLQAIVVGFLPGAFRVLEFLSFSTRS